MRGRGREERRKGGGEEGKKVSFRLDDVGAPTQTTSTTTHHVVALARLVPLALVAHGVKRRARRKQDAPVGALDGLLKGALGLSDRVGQGKDDRALVVRGHELEDLLGKGATDGRQAEERRGLDVLDDLLERAQLGRVGLGAREVLLVDRELVAAVVRDEALRKVRRGLGVSEPAPRLRQKDEETRAHLGVDEPELVLGLLLGAALVLKVLYDRLGDANAARPGAEEEDLLVLERDAVERKGADRTGEHDGARALDIVCSSTRGRSVNVGRVARTRGGEGDGPLKQG